jgi:hypothetical protein
MCVVISYYVSMNDNIFSQIRQEKTDFFDNYISIVPGYSFNQYYTLKRIHLYLNSKFEDSSHYLNRAKLFFNVVVPPCEVATKILDVDTKDIRLLPQNARTYFATYLLEKELKQWLKTSKLANVLNQIADQAPRYGSVVVEKTKDGAKVVDLRRLILDPTVEFIKDSRFVTTIHYMTPSELEKTGWDNVDVAIQRFGDGQAQSTYEDDDGSINQMQSTPYIKVYKRYGEVPQWWIDGGKSEKMVKALFIVAGAEEKEHNAEGKEVGEAGVILFKSRWYKDWPYKDFHYNKIIGRWLGLGIVESLFDVQERMNELKNQKRISMEISALHLFQTKDKQIVRNMLTDLENGDIMLSNSGIEPIATEERNLPAFNDEEESYFQQAQRLSFAYDAVSGEDSSASTTATAIINAQQQATSTFGFKRENFTNMLRDFFNDLVLPQLIKDLTPEHIMRFTGSSQELQKLDEASATLYANDRIKESIMGGKSVTPELQQMFMDEAIQTYRKLGDNRFLKIKQNFYKDAEFEFDFNIGNEQVNLQALAMNLQAILSSYNPQAMQDPRYKLLFYKYADTLGISQGEIEMADQEATKMVQDNPEQMGLPSPEQTGQEAFSESGSSLSTTNTQ